MTHDIFFRLGSTALFIFQLQRWGKFIEHNMYERLHFFRYVLLKSGTYYLHFVKTWYMLILFFVLTICDAQKREYKGRWNQPYR